MAVVVEPVPAPEQGGAREAAGFEQSDLQLRRTMGLTQLTALSLGAIIGSGWLFAVLSADGIAGPAAVLSWIIGGICVLFIAFSYMEISAMLPRTGALSRYPQITHGGYTGMLLGFAYLLSAVSVPAIEAEASVTYLSSKFPHIGLISPSTTIISWPKGVLLAFGFMLVFFVLNMAGIRLLSEVNRWVVLWKLVIPTLTFIFVFFAFRSSNFGSAVGGFTPLGKAPIFQAVATAGIVFSFLGFRQALEYAGEARNPQRDVPRATIISVLIAIVLYTMLQLAFTGAIRWGSMGVKVGSWKLISTGAWATGPFYRELHAAGMGVLAGFAALLIWDAVISPAGTGYVYMGTSVRTFYGMSVQRLFPPGLQNINRFGIPWPALIASFFVGGLFFVRQPSWYGLVGFITSATVLTYLMGGAGVMVFRRLAPDWPRPVRLPAPWVLTALGFIAAVEVVYWSGFSVLVEVMTFMFLSIVIYLWYYAPVRGYISQNQGLALGLVFLASWIWIAAKGGWVLRAGTLPVSGSWTFGTYYVMFCAAVVFVTVAIWLISNQEGRKQIDKSWWFIVLCLILFLLSYYGDYGYNTANPVIHFPWADLIVAGVALLIFFWAVHSGFETDEMKELAEAFGAPLAPEPETASSIPASASASTSAATSTSAGDGV
ncbi:MAG: APC family permease [Acidimicrobiales bacterium]